MELTQLGRSGLKISPLALGCMTYGVASAGMQPWALDEAASRPLLRAALEAGINFFDTANMYSAGTSEEIVGRAIKDFANRQEIVIATKVFIPMPGRRNAGGLSRKEIIYEAECSLRRLGTDYIDLYQLHRLDPKTPIEETLEALDHLVRSGKVLYLGASSCYAWQFCEALHLAGEHGWSKFVSMQNHLNLIYREEEREMLPLCKSRGIGVIPWSPLARGKLSRPWSDEATTDRERKDRMINPIYGRTGEADKSVVETLTRVAARLGVPQAQLALAWVIQKPEVTAPIVGVSKMQHLTDAIGALSLKLDGETIAELEAPYVPHPVSGIY
jgi:aryl-alcohol dehydrogenase-like predicted oxidoreductase